MRQHAWPGNLRQLASVLRTASAMLNDGETCIDYQHLPDDMAQDLVTAPTAPALARDQAPHSLQALSSYAVKQALEASRGNISLAARTLGISRQTLYRKMGARQS
jgi:transcriptional regulator of acetoin/glycerol metabolism